MGPGIASRSADPRISAMTMSGGAGGRERRRNGWLPLPSNTVIENPALQAVPIALELREAIGASEPPRAGARRPRRLLPDQEVGRSRGRNGYPDGRNDAADEQLADVHFGSDARGGRPVQHGGRGQPSGRRRPLSVPYV